MLAWLACDALAREPGSMPTQFWQLKRAEIWRLVTGGVCLPGGLAFLQKLVVERGDASDLVLLRSSLRPEVIRFFAHEKRCRLRDLAHFQGQYEGSMLSLAGVLTCVPPVE